MLRQCQRPKHSRPDTHYCSWKRDFPSTSREKLTLIDWQGTCNDYYRFYKVRLKPRIKPTYLVAPCRTAVFNSERPALSVRVFFGGEKGNDERGKRSVVP